MEMIDIRKPWTLSEPFINGDRIITDKDATIAIEVCSLPADIKNQEDVGRLIAAAPLLLVAYETILTAWLKGNDLKKTVDIVAKVLTATEISPLVQHLIQHRNLNQD